MNKQSLTKEDLKIIDKGMIESMARTAVKKELADLHSLLLDMVGKLESNERFLFDVIDVIIKYLKDKSVEDEFLLMQLFEVRGIDWKTHKHRDLNYLKHKLNILEEKHDGLQGELRYKTDKLQEAIKDKKAKSKWD